MKVKELIEQLQSKNQDAEVVIMYETINDNYMQRDVDRIEYGIDFEQGEFITRQNEVQLVTYNENNRPQKVKRY